MSPEMNDPLCVIVGMGPGMGLAIAKRFAKEGFAIAQIARRMEALEKFNKQLSQYKVPVGSYPADIADFRKLKDTFKKIRKDLGDAEILIFNASVLNPASPTALKVEDLMHELKVNVASALVAAQQVIPHMKTKKRGKIFFTGGGLALKPYHEFTSLSLGKAAIRSLSICLSQELNDFGIHISTITINGMIEKGTHFDPDKIAKEYWRLYSQNSGKQEIEIVYK